MGAALKAVFTEVVLKTTSVWPEVVTQHQERRTLNPPGLSLIRQSDIQ